jgi:hypothetical protein
MDELLSQLCDLAALCRNMADAAHPIGDELRELAGELEQHAQALAAAADAPTTHQSIAGSESS